MNTSPLVSEWDALADTLSAYGLAGERVRYAAGVKPLLRLPRAARILDAGCGSGRLLRTLDALGYRRLTGLEISPRRLDRVRQLGPRSAELVCDAGLPFAAASFDAVVSVAVVEHVAAPRHWLEQLARVVRPGGVASVVTDSYMWCWLQRLGLYRSTQPIDRALWPRTLVRWASQAGLRLEACGGFHNTPQQRWYFLRQLSQLRPLRRLRARWAHRWADIGGKGDGHARAGPGPTRASEPADTNRETVAILAALDDLPRYVRFGWWRCIGSYECFYWFRKA